MFRLRAFIIRGNRASNSKQNIPAEQKNTFKEVLRLVSCVSIIGFTLLVRTGAAADTYQHETIIIGTGAEFTGVSEVIYSLSVHGFSILLIESTFLNRVRILSQKDDLIRETIFSRSTGLILRDETWLEASQN